ncbi:MAG: glycosyltransferase family 4 protein [Patescibacteria group bacterium]
MKLLILTQKVDSADDNLGFFHRWIEEFAQKCESVVVICLYEGVHALPKNVHVLSLGKEKGPSHFKYLRRFYAYIWRERKNYDAVFVHMNPIYVVLGGVVWRALKKRIGLWYTHGSVSASLRLATILAHDIFTSTTESFRIQSNKTHIVGHGIDLERFIPSTEILPRDVLRVVTFGRISRVKGYETLIDAIRIVTERGTSIILSIIGGPGTPDQVAYEKKLHDRVKELGLSEKITFVGPVPQKDILPYLHKAHVFVSASTTGALDKAPLEAMAAGLPVVTCNEGTLSVSVGRPGVVAFPQGDAQTLANALLQMAQRSDGEFQSLRVLVQKIASEHRLQSLIERMVGILNDAHI